MNIRKFLGVLCVLTMVLSGSAYANALQEDRAWQFKSATASQYQLNAELARIKLKNGGFKQIFNVTADGASTVYVGNNHVGDNNYEQQNNITNVANQSVVDVTGDGNSVTVGQNNENSSQGGTVGYAIGSKFGQNTGAVGLNVGVPLSPSP